MNLELLVFIVIFLTLLFSMLGFFLQINSRMDNIETTLSTHEEEYHSELSGKIDKMHTEIATRLDSVNLRIDNLHH